VKTAIDSPLIAIIILNWNGTSDTLECLASLSQIKRDGLSIQMIVIDNGSDSDATIEIQTAFPETKTLRLPQNIGFAAGCNVGIKEAMANRAEYMLFLNNDTEVEPGFVLPLIAAVQNNPQIGIACSLIKTMDDSIDFAGATIGFATGSFKHIHRLRSGSSPIKTDYATGCSMLVPARILQAIGIFDESLFSYFEDTDLSLRAQRSGFETVIVPESIVRHKGSASTRRGLNEGTTSPLKHYLVARNRIIIVHRYGSRLARWFHFAIANPIRTLFYTGAFLIRGRWEKMRAMFRGMADGLKVIRNDSKPR
jgi:GT2 family glycosyltransferase